MTVLNVIKNSVNKIPQQKVTGMISSAVNLAVTQSLRYKVSFVPRILLGVSSGLVAFVASDALIESSRLIWKNLTK